MKKHTSFFLLLISLSFTPILTFAAPFEGVKGLLTAFGGLLNLIIPILFGLSLVYFFWGVSQFILRAGEQKAREEGRNKMIWGIIALFVFVSIYGILGLIGGVLGINVSGSSSSSSSYSSQSSQGNPAATFTTPGCVDPKNPDCFQQ